jgi:hypothetical protein
VKDSKFLGFSEDSSWGYGSISAATLPNDGVNCNNSFANLLRDFVEGKAGVPFTPGGLCPNDHWSAFVNEMLRVAALGDYTYLSTRTQVDEPLSRNGSVESYLAVMPTLGFISQRFGTRRVRLSENNNFHFSPWLRGDDYIITRDLCKWADEASGHNEIPPDNIEYSSPPEDPGHIPIISLITFGKDCDFDC